MVLSRKFLKFCLVLIVFILFTNFILFLTNRSLVDKVKPRVLNALNRKISWEDWEFVHYERTRSGPGENGEEWIVTDPEAKKRNEEWVRKEGFYVEVSNNMSLTRALPEHRLPMYVVSSSLSPLFIVLFIF